MQTIIYDTHLKVPLDLINKERVKAELYVENLAATKASHFGRYTNEPIGYSLYQEEDGYAVLPRGYSVPIIQKGFNVIDWRPAINVFDKFPVFRRKLWSKQLPATETLIRTIGDKLLCLGCGKGKTVIAIWYACQLKRKTLIIVDRDFLMDQWLDRIVNCTWHPRAKIGIIKGKKCIIGEYFTIAMAHTLSKRIEAEEFDDDFYKSFGLVIFDEVHVASAPTFSVVLPSFPGERLGLTATDRRRDGLDPVFKMHLGGEPIFTDISRERSSRWYFKRLPRLLTEQEEAKCYRRIPGKTKRGGKPVFALQRPVFDSIVSDSQRWLDIIVHDVIEATQKGRNTILLGGRKEQLYRLGELGEAYGLDIGVATSEVKGVKRKAVFEKQIIAATSQLASRALDIPRLDTLFLLFPTDDEGFVRQAVGRTDRDNGQDSVVVVYSHAYTESLEKKEKAMIEMIRDIDPGAQITIVGS